MFDVGFWEILVIGIVALLVVGPERLPGVARKAGRWVGQAQRFVRNARDDIQRELEAENLKSMIDQQEKQIHELRSIVQDTRGDDTLTELREQLNQSADEIKRNFHGQDDAPDAGRHQALDQGRDSGPTDSGPTDSGPTDSGRASAASGSDADSRAEKSS